LQEEEKRKGPLDKVAQREFCKRTGIFENVPYLNIRKLFSESSEPIVFEFRPESFSDFPYKEVLRYFSNSHSYIFENIIDGFRIRASPKGSFTITSKDELVKRVEKETRVIKSPKERLQVFLRELCEVDYSISKIGYVSNQITKQKHLIDALLSHPTNLYIKGAHGSGGGYLVVRLRKDGAHNIVESDSKSYADLLDKHNVQGSIVNTSKKRMERHNHLEAKNVLNFLFTRIRNPIIEEEVPYETINGKRAEFRVICQLVSGRFEVTGYAKVSEKTISANISLGGSAEHTENVFKEIYHQRSPPMSSSELESKVTQAKQNLLMKAKKFAEENYACNLSKAELQQVGVAAPMDFAIDIVPAWNNETQEVNLYFLEINYQYGFLGLKKIDPEAAKRVMKNKSKLG